MDDSSVFYPLQQRTRELEQIWESKELHKDDREEAKGNGGF